MALTRMIGRVASWARRYGWVAYWLAFAVDTLLAARNPGYVAHPETAPYPWAAALLTCAFLGGEAAALNAVLRPLHATRGWKRVAAASGIALVLAALNLLLVATDMPGYYYAAARFALANVVVVPVVGTLLVMAPQPDRQDSTRSIRL